MGGADHIVLGEGKRGGYDEVRDDMSEVRFCMRYSRLGLFRKGI